MIKCKQLLSKQILLGLAHITSKMQMVQTWITIDTCLLQGAHGIKALTATNSRWLNCGTYPHNTVLNHQFATEIFTQKYVNHNEYLACYIVYLNRSTLIYIYFSKIQWSNSLWTQWMHTMYTNLYFKIKYRDRSIIHSWF